MRVLIVTNRKLVNADADDHSMFGESVNVKGASELRLAWSRKTDNGYRLELIAGDPFFKPGVTTPAHRSPFNDYMGRLKTQVELTLTQLTRERRGEQVDRLVHAIFGSCILDVVGIEPRLIFFHSCFAHV